MLIDMFQNATDQLNSYIKYNEQLSEHLDRTFDNLDNLDNLRNKGNKNDLETINDMIIYFNNEVLRTREIISYNNKLIKYYLEQQDKYLKLKYKDI